MAEQAMPEDAALDFDPDDYEQTDDGGLIVDFEPSKELATDDAYERGRADGAAGERERIVAKLRMRAGAYKDSLLDSEAGIARDLADLIESETSHVGGQQ